MTAKKKLNIALFDDGSVRPVFPKNDVKRMARVLEDLKLASYGDQLPRVTKARDALRELLESLGEFGENTGEEGES